MKKKKLMPVKELRRHSELQQILISQQLLKINRLENEVESLEGARVNLRTMYEVRSDELLNARNEKSETYAQLRTAQRDYDSLSALARDITATVTRYREESAGRMVVRAAKKALAPIGKSISAFFERLRFRFKKVQQ